VGVSAEDAVLVDLSHLGLAQRNVENARLNPEWSNSEWGYQEGIVIHFGTPQQNAVSIWALKYEDIEMACTDLSSLADWAMESGGSCVWGGQVMSCEWADAHEEILCNDYWIIDIVGAEGASITGEELVTEVREALAIHWRALTQLEPSADLPHEKSRHAVSRFPS
jgi:hypothetical protein